MLNASAIHLAVLAVFVGLMIWAAVEDARRFVIPNYISLLLVALYPAHVLLAPAPIAWMTALAIGAGVLAVGFLLFSRGYFGGGDAKLLAAVSLWAGPDQFLRFTLATALAGGVLALALLVVRRLRRATPQAALAGQGNESKSATQMQLPYGVAIAAGGLTAVLGSLIGG
jgi:prepilin peptidase CpaA